MAVEAGRLTREWLLRKAVVAQKEGGGGGILHFNFVGDWSNVQCRGHLGTSVFSNLWGFCPGTGKLCIFHSLEHPGEVWAFYFRGPEWANAKKNDAKSSINYYS